MRNLNVCLYEYILELLKLRLLATEYTFLNYNFPVNVNSDFLRKPYLILWWFKLPVPGPESVRD